MKYLLIAALALSACKNRNTGSGGGGDSDNLPDPVGVYIPSFDGVIHGQAIITLTQGEDVSFWNILNPIPKAYAATSSATVTYINAPATTFTLNTGSLVAGSFSGDTLDLGSLSISALVDNNLRDCGPSNNQKCTNAYIRVYTSGSVAGFVHSSNEYGVPIYAAHNDIPNVLVDLGSGNAATLQSRTIPNNLNRIRLSDFTTPTYNFNSDFSNAGAGSYSVTIVVQYALSL